MFNPTSPVTGAPITGLTNPTYTLSVDVAPNAYGKQWAVTALGGTQTGVSAHTASNPFTLTAQRPPLVQASNPAPKSVGAVQRNKYVVRTRKGVKTNADGFIVPLVIETTFSIPAGAEAFDLNSLLAAESMHQGAITQQLQGIVDTCTSGLI